jgi:DNA polymerase-3 subunit gamma/tau
VLGCISLLEEIVMQGRELTQFVTDFTWYLRNLMLVQSSDNLEDVIDMSTDNLARLKEEAGMLEQDMIIRYIRIFSELSGQIKYASQKRILVEIALIKLCKPNMETTDDALLDRIRQVEDKVENGVFVAQGNSAVSGAGTAAASVPQVKSKPQLPKAVPEDVKRIVNNWPSIVGNATQPMKTYLKSAKLSLGGDNKLMVVLEDGNSSDYFTQHLENKEQLEFLLSEFSGKDIEVTLRTVGSSNEFEENYVDLSKIINMDIEEED